MNNKMIVGILIICVILVAGYLVINNNGSVSQTTQTEQNPVAQQSPPTLPTSTNEESVVNNQSVTDITVEGTEFAFVPSNINVKKDQQIRLTFKNSGKYPHDLSISDLNVQTKTIQPNQEDTVTFTADKVGQFNLICTVDSHADKGMKGTITVN